MPEWRAQNLRNAAKTSWSRCRMMRVQ
jgi:hypothetical protein